jgi:hypothetical protein
LIQRLLCVHSKVDAPQPEVSRDRLRQKRFRQAQDKPTRISCSVIPGTRLTVVEQDSSYNISGWQAGTRLRHQLAKRAMAVSGPSR